MIRHRTCDRNHLGTLWSWPSSQTRTLNSQTLTLNNHRQRAQQRFGTIQAPRIVGSASAWLPMGCAETLAIRLPYNDNQAARDTLAHRPSNACGSRRSLAVAPLIADQRCYGESPVGLRRDCRPTSRNGPGGWRWTRGQMLAIGPFGGPKHPTSNIQHRTLNLEP
jgi:hypothetical protein